jgi:hypothetical protein
LSLKLVLFSIIILNPIGRPLNPTELKSLLTEALKIDECVRLVRVQRPIPLRFRRATTGEKFQCTITLD